jgi:hypothetical protein
MLICCYFQVMGKQNHIVQKLTVEIGLAAQEEAFNIQSKISNDHQRLMLDTMSEIFDRLVGENEVVKIDRLEINLGNISAEHLEYELQEKIRKEIEEALIKLLFEVRSSPHGNAEVRIETSVGDTITVQANVQDRSFSLLDTLVYFLEYGVLPWSDDKKVKPTLRFLVAQAMEKHPDQLRQTLQQLSHKEYIFRRLSLQLPEEQLHYLAAILGSSFSSKLPVLFKEIERWIETVLRDAGNELSPGKTMTAAQLRLFIREETLRYFSANNGSAAISSAQSDVIFIGEILAKIISHFEIPVTAALIRKVKSSFENAVEAAVKKLLADTVEAEQKRKNKKEEPEEIIQPKKKEELPETPEVDEGIYIENAGLVILAPYLPGFFRNLGLVTGKEFVDDDAKWKAVHLLQWLVEGGREKEEEKQEDEKERTELTEHDLVLNKIICGIDIAEPVPVSFELSENEKEEGIKLLKAVIGNWTIISRISVMSLQTTFLVKEGKLRRMEKDWHLFIHRDSAIDMLIDKLPWGISMTRFPWNKETIYVEW